MTINIISDFIKPIKDNFNHNQPWLEKRFIPARSASTGTMLRMSQKGGTVRNPGIESMARTCERGMLHELFGVSSFKIPKSEGTYASLGGDIFNNEIDRIISTDSRFKIGNELLSREPYFEKAGKVCSWIPKDRQFTNAANKQRKVFMGVYDYSFINNDGNMEIIELKSCVDNDIPMEPREKAIRQLAIYVAETRSESGHLVYLPSDLNTIDLQDESSFAVFTISYDEAIDIISRVHETLEISIKKLMWSGNDTYPWGSPKWFYRIVETAPICDEVFCCGASENFHKEFEVNSDWTFQQR